MALGGQYGNLSVNKGYIAYGLRSRLEYVPYQLLIKDLINFSKELWGGTVFAKIKSLKDLHSIPGEGNWIIWNSIFRECK